MCVRTTERLIEEDIERATFSSVFLRYGVAVETAKRKTLRKLFRYAHQKLVSRRFSSPFRIQRYKKRGGVGVVAGRRGRFEGKINDVFWRRKEEGTF